MTTTATRWTDTRFELAEGPRWLGDRMVFVDILGGCLYEVAELSSEQPTPNLLQRVDVPLGAVAPVEGSDHDWIAAAGTGIAILHGSDGSLE